MSGLEKPFFVQVIFGSALCALEDKRPDIGVEAVKQLLDVLDNKSDLHISMIS